MKITVELDVPEDHAHVTLIRQMGRMLLEHRRAAAEDVDDIEVVLGELCANVTRHAKSAAGCFHVMMEHHGEHVVVVVTDHGAGLNTETIPMVGAARPDEAGAERFGGFGLHLVDTLTDHVEFQPSEPTGTTVRAEKRLRAATR